MEVPSAMEAASTVISAASVEAAISTEFMATVEFSMFIATVAIAAVPHPGRPCEPRPPYQLRPNRDGPQPLAKDQREVSTRQSALSAFLRKELRTSDPHTVLDYGGSGGRFIPDIRLRGRLRHRGLPSLPRRSSAGPQFFQPLFVS